jgi:arginase
VRALTHRLSKERCCPKSHSSQLSEAGIAVDDHGNLPSVCCRVDPRTTIAERIADVQIVAGRVANCVEKIVSAQQNPLVIGGGCTIAIGVVAGFVRSQPDLALLYMDGGLDATTPAAYRLGRLDSTGMAHLVAEPHCEPLAPEQDFLARHDISGYPISSLKGRVAEAAAEARSHRESIAARFLVHFDIDVIDFSQFPAADVLQPKKGMTLEDAFGALRIFCVSPKFGGLVVTEFNPDHDDKNGTFAQQLIQGLAQAL